MKFKIVSCVLNLAFLGVKGFRLFFNFIVFYRSLNQSDSDNMSGDGDMLRLSARSRNSRSHSLKPQSQPMMLFKQRSKRTMSLPSKPVLLPLINIQRCHDNWNDQEDSDEDDCVASEEEMGMCQL